MRWPADPPRSRQIVEGWPDLAESCVIALAVSYRLNDQRVDDRRPSPGGDGTMTGCRRSTRRSRPHGRLAKRVTKNETIIRGERLRSAALSADCVKAAHPAFIFLLKSSGSSRRVAPAPSQTRHRSVPRAGAADPEPSASVRKSGRAVTPRIISRPRFCHGLTSLPVYRCIRIFPTPWLAPTGGSPLGVQAPPPPSAPPPRPSPLYSHQIIKPSPPRPVWSPSCWCFFGNIPPPGDLATFISATATPRLPILDAPPRSPRSRCFATASGGNARRKRASSFFEATFGPTGLQPRGCAQTSLCAAAGAVACFDRPCAGHFSPESGPYRQRLSGARSTRHRRITWYSGRRRSPRSRRLSQPCKCAAIALLSRLAVMPGQLGRAFFSRAPDWRTAESRGSRSMRSDLRLQARHGA